MSTLIERIETLDDPTAINCADQVSKQMIKDSNVSDAIFGETDYAVVLGEAFPTFSESIKLSGSQDLEIKGEISRNFLKVIAEDLKYTDIVENAIDNPDMFEPITMMIIAAAVVFVLQVKFHVSYKNGKLDTIDIEKKETSEDLIKQIFIFKPPA